MAVRIAVFSKYFGFNVGGAERSVLAIMESLEAEGNTIVAYVNRNPRRYGAGGRRFELPSSWEVRTFSLPLDWTRFRFVEYAANYRTLQSIAKSMTDIDVLYAYGHMSPAVLLAFAGKRVYLVRDEYGRQTGLVRLQCRRKRSRQRRGQSIRAEGRRLRAHPP